MTPLPTYSVATQFHPSGFRYTVVRVACDGYQPILRKVFAYDKEKSYTGGDFIVPEEEPLASFVKRTQAPIVVNADGWSEVLLPIHGVTGLQIKDGTLLSDFDDIPKGRHALGVLPSGEFRIYDRGRGDTATSVLADGVTDTFSYGPPLVIDGRLVDMESEYPQSEWDGPYGPRPRTLIGQSLLGDVFIVTVEGGRPWSAGAGGNVLASLMFEMGCHQAIMLDGGGSSQLWIDGRCVQQSTDLTPRAVVSVIAVNAIRADALASTGSTPISRASIDVSDGVTVSSAYFRMISLVDGTRLLSLKCAVTATEGVLGNDRLLFTLPAEARMPIGSNWIYDTAPIAMSGSTYGVGGLCFRGASGQVRTSRIISPAVHAPGQRWDVTMLLDFTPQTEW